MNTKKILSFLLVLIITTQMWGQKKYAGNKLQSKANCTIYAYATPSSIEQGLNTTLQIFTNDTLYSVSWAPSVSVTYPDSSSTTAYPAVTTTYTVTAKTSCGTFTDTVTVFIGCTIALNLITTPYYCSANPGTAEVVGYNGVSPYSYSWSNGQTTTRVKGGLTAGAYWIAVTDADKCAVSDTFNIPDEAISVSASAQPASIVAYDSSVLRATINDPGLSYTVLWAPSASVRRPNSASTYAYPLVTTTYTVTLTTPCGEFSDTATVYVTSPTSVDKINSIESSITISPNPGNGLFTLSYTLPKDENVRVTVMDELGRAIYVKEYGDQPGGVSTQLLNIQDATEGIYLVRLQTDDGIIAVRKVILQRNR